MEQVPSHDMASLLIVFSWVLWSGVGSPAWLLLKNFLYMGVIPVHFWYLWNPEVSNDSLVVSYYVSDGNRTWIF